MTESGSGPGIRRLIREFMMLVAGVLVALSADAWWQDQQTRSEIDLLLEVLASELEANREELGAAVRRRQVLVEQNQALVQLLNDGPPYPSVDSLRPLVFSALEGRPPGLSFGAYEVLVGRGSTEFVDAELLTRLASHVSSVRGGISWDDHVREGVIEDITDAISRSGGFLATTPRGFRTERGLPTPANQLDVSSLLADASFQNAASISVVLHYNWHRWLEDRLSETESLLVELR